LKLSPKNSVTVIQKISSQQCGALTKNSAMAVQSVAAYHCAD